MMVLKGFLFEEKMMYFLKEIIFFRQTFPRPMLVFNLRLNFLQW